MINGEAGIPYPPILEHKSLLLGVLEVEIGKIDIPSEHGTQLGRQLPLGEVRGC